MPHGVHHKHPACGRDGAVVANHPLGAAAGAQMLAAGGNAVDAAVAALLTLTVVEPMMVGIAGGGFMHLRLPDGKHVIIDAMATAPHGVHPEIYEPLSQPPPHHLEVRDRRNQLGPTAVAVPGNLLGWWEAHAQYGKLPFSDLLEPAVQHASRGFAISPYLAGAIHDNVEDIAADKTMADVFLPKGDYPRAGTRLVQGAYGESLRLIQQRGCAALHGGPLGAALAERIANDPKAPGWLTLEDLVNYRTAARAPISGHYRGFDIVGPPPPASSGVHIVQMLNIIEAFDVARMGFGSKETLHLLAETLRIAFADRRAHSGDPAFVDVPVERLTSKAYADTCRAQLRSRGGIDPYLLALPESPHTTHVTVADRDGGIVTATHTINQIFGARFMVPDTGIIPNNYMSNFDPHPGRALSIAPGKRVPTSMAPMVVLRDGVPLYALGMPGGLRIFGSVFQGIINLIDHGMDLQAAVESPRLWTQGQAVEIETGYADRAEDLTALGHDVMVVPHIGGGMNAVSIGDDGLITGAACWRADGMAIALGGGLAQPGVRFWPDQTPDRNGSSSNQNRK